MHQAYIYIGGCASPTLKCRDFSKMLSFFSSKVLKDKKVCDRSDKSGVHNNYINEEHNLRSRLKNSVVLCHGWWNQLEHHRTTNYSLTCQEK